MSIQDQNCAFTFMWQIENFSCCAEGTGESLNSPSFTVLPFNKTGFHLCIFPRGRQERDEHLSLTLRKNRSLEDTYTDALDCEYSFLDDRESPVATATVRNQVCPRGTGLDLPHTPTQMEVFVHRKESFLPGDTLTIRCRLWRSKGDSESLSGRCIVRTRVAVQKISMVWPIRSFSKLQLNQVLSTPVELFPERLESYTVHFSLVGQSLGSSRSKVVITADTIKRVTVATCKVTLLTSKGKIRKWTTAKHWFSEAIGSKTWNFPSVFTRQELVDKQSRYLQDDVLTLVIEYEVSAKGSNLVDYTCFRLANRKEEFPTDRVLSAKKSMPDRIETSSTARGERIDSGSLLQDDLLSLYRDHPYSDFKLRCGDVTFPVHKSVLSIRSPVFKAILAGNVSDSKVMVIRDLDIHTLNRMLTFLYTGAMDTELPFENATKLYYAADKYEVHSLKRECSSVLRSRISVSNACYVLVLANRHQDDHLQSFVHDFIFRHYDEVVVSKEWDWFMDNETHLAGKTMQLLYKKRLQDKGAHNVNWNK